MSEHWTGEDGRQRNQMKTTKEQRADWRRLLQNDPMPQEIYLVASANLLDLLDDVEEQAEKIKTLEELLLLARAGEEGLWNEIGRLKEEKLAAALAGKERVTIAQACKTCDRISQKIQDAYAKDALAGKELADANQQ
jgi:hypothetical protein